MFLCQRQNLGRARTVVAVESRLIDVEGDGMEMGEEKDKAVSVSRCMRSSVSSGRIAEYEQPAEIAYVASKHDYAAVRVGGHGCSE